MRSKVLVVALFVMTLFLAITPDVEARLFGRRRGGATGAGYNLTYAISTEKTLYGNTMSLQDVAMMRAKWMAHRGYLSHNIHYNIAKCPKWNHPGASGEGIGCSTTANYKDCSTCIVGGVVVADGHARSKSGMVYRVRLFR